MPLSTAQQAALFTIALVLVGVGALGTADALQAWGFPPIAGFFFLVSGIIGSALIKAYGLQQQTSLKQKILSLLAEASTKNRPTPPPAPTSENKTDTPK